MGSLTNTSAVLASDVANAGTFNVPYPAGFNQGLLIGSTNGRAVVNDNDVYPQAPSGANTVAFTFGASNITVTNNTGRTLAAGSRVLLSFGDNAEGGSFNPEIRVDAIVSLTAASGTSSDTIADVTATPTQALINNNFKATADKINEIITALRAAGILVS
ncbi:MAG: hypothetical protein ACOVN5_07150 [Aquidulcibacter sp.]